MNYHNITKADMLNGMGLRVVLWVSGCNINCPHCQNPETHPFNSGIQFDNSAELEILEELKKPYIAGITFTGGHPLEDENLPTVNRLINEIRELYPDKNIWLYTGYTLQQLKASKEKWDVINKCDVVVTGPYIEALKDERYHWAGSTNQRVIDINASKELGKVVLLEDM